jgi:hypothetical protein
MSGLCDFWNWWDWCDWCTWCWDTRKKTCHRRKARSKCRRHTGLRGPTGPTGATGTLLDANWITFSATVSVMPVDPFAVLTSSGFGNIMPFDATTSNPFPPNFAQTFLVPFNGVMSDLIIRIQGRSPDTNVTGAVFSCTVYKSAFALGSSGSTPGWTATGLSVVTAPISIASGSSMSVSTQNVVTVIPVLAGDLVAVVIAPTGFSFFDIQPGTINATLRYEKQNFG